LATAPLPFPAIIWSQVPDA